MMEEKSIFLNNLREAYRELSMPILQHSLGKDTPEKSKMPSLWKIYFYQKHA